MILVQWDEEKYDVGVKAFNAHHKRLVDIINLLHSTADGSNNLNHISVIYKELIDYTKYHFDVEEKLMLKYKYDNYHLQKLEHKKFVDSLTKSFEKFKTEFYIVELMELIDFLGDWILDHILNTDKQYKEFFEKNGVN
jgi:hemerythrin-like metal-binding protein